MKKNYTEFIVRVYHKRKGENEHLFTKWIRLYLTKYSYGRKITVKKHKSLSKDKL